MLQCVTISICYIAVMLYTMPHSSKTAIYHGIKHVCYIACYIAENRLFTMLYTMQNAAIGLVTSATASIMAGSSLVRWSQQYVAPCQDCPDWHPMHTYQLTRTLVMSKSRLKLTRSTVRPSAVVTTLTDSQRHMQTSGSSRDSRAGIFFQTWTGPTTPEWYDWIYIIF